MTHLPTTWIVCEPTPRWASALRLRAAHVPCFRDQPPRLREVRSLREATAELATAADGLLLVAVGEYGLPDVLAWLPAVLDRHPLSRAVALLDRSPDRPELSTVLREAGFVEMSTSPRDLGVIFEVASGHRAASRQHRLARLSRAPVTEQVWATLPWQAEVPPLG